MSLLRNMAADRMTSEQTLELQKLSGQTIDGIVVAGPSACPDPLDKIQTQNNQHVNFFSELEAGKCIHCRMRDKSSMFLSPEFKKPEFSM